MHCEFGARLKVTKPLGPSGAQPPSDEQGEQMASTDDGRRMATSKRNERAVPVILARRPARAKISRAPGVSAHTGKQQRCESVERERAQPHIPRFAGQYEGDLVRHAASCRTR